MLSFMENNFWSTNIVLAPLLSTPGACWTVLPLYFHSLQYSPYKMISMVWTWTIHSDRVMKAGPRSWEFCAWQASSAHAVPLQQHGESSETSWPWSHRFSQTRDNEPKSIWTVYQFHFKHKEDQHGFGSSWAWSLDDTGPGCQMTHHNGRIAGHCKYSLNLWPSNFVITAVPREKRELQVGKPRAWLAPGWHNNLCSLAASRKIGRHRKSLTVSPIKKSTCDFMEHNRTLHQGLS